MYNGPAQLEMIFQKDYHSQEFMIILLFLLFAICFNDCSLNLNSFWAWEEIYSRFLSPSDPPYGFVSYSFFIRALEGVHLRCSSSFLPSWLNLCFFWYSLQFTSIVLFSFYNLSNELILNISNCAYLKITKIWYE